MYEMARQEDLSVLLSLMRGLMISKLNIFMLFFMVSASSLYAEYTKTGEIETLREDGYITVIFNKVPDRDHYFILSEEKAIGKISFLKQIPDVYGKKRYLCRYFLLNPGYKQILRAGLEIAIPDSDKEIDKRLQNNPYIESVVYKSQIISIIDNREMILIPAGKFLMGCSLGDEDEFPEHVEFIGDFYIDKFETSNSDYKKYADIKGLGYPEYWMDKLDSTGRFISPYFGSLPVIVTYYEAADYAKWAGKRLPSENEWEKASRPPLSMDTAGKGASYIRGGVFIEGISNTEELWLSEKTGENLKKKIIEKYGPAIPEKGYIPVDIYENDSLSYYGVAQLDGNALEWTDSWYQPYAGNTKSNKKYGTQYKVIRGGAYFLSAVDSRVTDRKTGGMPDLYKDRMAGFRCVKNIAEGDKK